MGVASFSGTKGYHYNRVELPVAFEGCPARTEHPSCCLRSLHGALTDAFIRADLLLGGREARIAVLIAKNPHAANILRAWLRVDHCAIADCIVNGPMVLGNKAKVRSHISLVLRSCTGSGCKRWRRQAHKQDACDCELFHSVFSITQISSHEGRSLDIRLPRMRGEGGAPATLPLCRGAHEIRFCDIALFEARLRRSHFAGARPSTFGSFSGSLHRGSLPDSVEVSLT